MYFMQNYQLHEVEQYTIIMEANTIYCLGSSSLLSQFKLDMEGILGLQSGALDNLQWNLWQKRSTGNMGTYRHTKESLNMITF